MAAQFFDVEAGCSDSDSESCPTTPMSQLSQESIRERYENGDYASVPDTPTTAERENVMPTTPISQLSQNELAERYITNADSQESVPIQQIVSRDTIIPETPPSQMISETALSEEETTPTANATTALTSQSQEEIHGRYEQFANATETRILREEGQIVRVLDIPPSQQSSQNTTSPAQRMIRPGTETLNRMIRDQNRTAVRFRLNARQFFLTFPQTTATKEEAERNLRARNNWDRIEWFVIAEEHHQNERKHLHILLRFGREMNPLLRLYNKQSRELPSTQECEEQSEVCNEGGPHSGDLEAPYYISKEIPPKIYIMHL